jgi:hypothetical protein
MDVFKRAQYNKPLERIIRAVIALISLLLLPYNIYYVK